MEKQINESDCDTVILILETKRFVVDKKKLIGKSRYFSTLLSANYSDHFQSEHVINYEIPLLIFEDFIQWIHQRKFNINYDEDKIEHFLILLELSVLFGVDDLIKDVTHILETQYLSPKNVIDIWMLTQELSLNILRDICFVLCLDRFTELPISSIYKLSKENFLRLIGNVNIKATKSYLHQIKNNWTKHNQLNISLSILKNKKSKILHGIISCVNPGIIGSKLYLHCWNGEDLFEFAQFEFPKDLIIQNNGKNLIKGMGYAIREYDIYFCGGEFGIGSGKFNTTLWRYSLISKKWYAQAVMPNVRRHMVVAFLQNKLLLVGGVGRYRLKTNNHDIYNIYTGTWSKGACIPIYFCDVPNYYVFNGKLAIYICTDIYLYLPNEDVWKTISAAPTNITTTEMKDILILAPDTAACCIETNRSDQMIIRNIKEACDVNCIVRNGRCVKVNFTFPYSFPDLGDKDYVLKLIVTVPSFNIWIRIFDEKTRPLVLIVYWDYGYRTVDLEQLYMHVAIIKDVKKYYSLFHTHLPKRFFDLSDPADLYV